MEAGWAGDPEEPRAVGFIGFLLNMVPLAFVAIEQMALFFTHLT